MKSLMLMSVLAVSLSGAASSFAQTPATNQSPAFGYPLPGTNSPARPPSTGTEGTYAPDFKGYTDPNTSPTSSGQSYPPSSQRRAPVTTTLRSVCSESFQEEKIFSSKNRGRRSVFGTSQFGTMWVPLKMGARWELWSIRGAGGRCRSAKRKGMKMTVIQRVLSCLPDIGIKDVFGVAGDFAFPIDDAVSSNRNLRWVGCCNELNAAYAADGYARTHGIAALCTTYGVGELSAICGVGGAYAEHVPVIHLVGMPSSGAQDQRRLVHHTLGNGEFGLFFRMAEPVVCAQAIMTPENCVAETERLIAAALYHRRPV
jgi:hypothetical protein